MKDKKFIEMMHDELEDLIPDNKDRIKARLGILETSKKRKFSFVKPVLAFAMVFALAFGLFQFMKGKNPTPSLTIIGKTYVSIDVNPSIEFVLDENLNVTTCTPKNDKAKTLLVNVDYVGKNIDDVSNDLIKRLNEVGYISITNKKNAVLVTTINEDNKSQKAVQEKIDKNISTYFEENHIFGVVIDGENIKNNQLVNEANKLSISVGKMKLVETIYNSYDPLDPDRKTKEQLAKMKMNQLHDLLEDLEDKRDHVMDDLEDDLDKLVDLLEDVKELTEAEEENKNENSEQEKPDVGKPEEKPEIEKPEPGKPEEYEKPEVKPEEPENEKVENEKQEAKILVSSTINNTSKIDCLKFRVEKQIEKIDTKYSPLILKAVKIDYEKIDSTIKQVEQVKKSCDKLDDHILDSIDKNHLSFKTDEFNTLKENELNKLKDVDKNALEEDYHNNYDAWLEEEKDKYESDWDKQKLEWEKQFKK